ncbi:hypothetical protein HKX48_003754 [Thoreauomyces humboldtii]|nr:hypothetical protein HKX48_003754 [Thoreauomyces humboldtii]
MSAHSSDDDEYQQPLTEEQLAAKRQHDIDTYTNDIIYSNRYSDETSEYRHVTLPKQIARWVPDDGLMSDQEWRSLGVMQSPGWEHYMRHAPEPHILLFRREKDYQIKYPNAVPPAPGNVVKQAVKPERAGAAAGKKVGGLIKDWI